MATKEAEMAAKLERLDKIEVFQRTAADEKLPEATRPDWTFRKGTVIVPMVPKDHASYKPGDHDYVWVEFEDVASNRDAKHCDDGDVRENDRG